MIILYVCRAGHRSKYSLLPESWVSDRGGKMYAPLTGDEFGRTLVGVAWSDPKAETHGTFCARRWRARAWKLTSTFPRWRLTSEAPSRRERFARAREASARAETSGRTNPFGYFGEGTPRGDHGHTYRNTLTGSAVCYHACPGPGVCVGDSRVSRRRRSARVRRLARQQSVRGVPFLVIVRVAHEQHGVHVFDGVELPRARLGDQSENAMMHYPGEPVAAVEQRRRRRRRKRRRKTPASRFERRGRPTAKKSLRSRSKCRRPRARLARWSSWT